jgi:hypothetical protein
MKTLTGIAVTAALGAALVTGTARFAGAQTPAAQPAATPKAKTPKDQTEADIANAVFTDMVSNPPKWEKTISDLNGWVQKYPESDWKNERLLYYLTAYANITPPQKDKALEYAAQLLAMDVPAAIADKSDVLKVYTYTSMAVVGIQNATPQQLATGDKGAKALLAYLPTFFAPANKPATATDAQWNSTRKGLEDLAAQAELTIATYPGDVAAAKKDWPAAELGYQSAFMIYPDNANIAYSLGLAVLQQKNPATYPRGLYYVARAAAEDPAKGGIADPTKRTAIDTFLKNTYVGFHGADDGLDDLKKLALASPTPAADFTIENTSQIAARKQKEFQHDYPQVALWMSMKGMLAGTDSDAGFAAMKDSMVKGENGARGLTGQILSGEPACHSKSVVVGVPVPGSTATVGPEITLKLDKPLTGKPVAGTIIKWDGVPSAFTKDPAFMLTMDVDQADIDGMVVDPCTAAPAKKAAPKKAPAKKAQ